MLLEVIFLVLSAVVLTVVGVGYMGEKATVKEVSRIGGGKISGRYLPSENEIDVAKQVVLPTGDVHTLTGGQKKFVKYHEEAHEFMSKLGYLSAAENERYADHVAIYRSILEGDTKTAWDGVKYLHKTGRINHLGNQQTINDIVTYLATGKKSGRVEEGMIRTKNLLYEASNYLPREQQTQRDAELNMSLKPIIINKDGKNRVWEGLKYLRDLGIAISEDSNTIDGNFKKHKYSPEKGYPTTSEITAGATKTINKIFDPIYYKPLGLKKSSGNESSHAG